ncbi:MAG: NUDIX hydrolase N-terminal domain-containing protein [Deltaproteobacteria bacterium]|nr:NUDIX hydrolase N-terminal domain-containing protein [Deltaproteobacteria bacterium]
MDDQGLPRWLTWAREIQALCQTGLAFSQNQYDVKRCRRLMEIAAEMVACHTGESVTELTEGFISQPGYATPKVDVRCAALRQGEILMVQERCDGRWTLPGGWADVGETPAEMVVRETWEESGFDVVPRKVVGVWDANRGGRNLVLYHAYKVLFLCDIVGGQGPLGGLAEIHVGVHHRARGLRVGQADQLANVVGHDVLHVEAARIPAGGGPLERHRVDRHGTTDELPLRVEVSVVIDVVLGVHAAGQLRGLGDPVDVDVSRALGERHGGNAERGVLGQSELGALDRAPGLERRIDGREDLGVGEAGGDAVLHRLGGPGRVARLPRVLVQAVGGDTVRCSEGQQGQQGDGARHGVLLGQALTKQGGCHRA